MEQEATAGGWTDLHAYLSARFWFRQGEEIRHWTGICRALSLRNKEDIITCSNKAGHNKGPI